MNEAYHEFDSAWAEYWLVCMVMNYQTNSCTSTSSVAMVIGLCVYMESQTIGVSTWNKPPFLYQEGVHISWG